jgi:IclR family pca regulon transcriptional regulator
MSRPPAAAKTEAVAAFARGLAVIRAFGPGAEALSVSEAAARAGLTRAGARRLLLTLVEEGYATHDGRRYALAPRVLELGFGYLAGKPLWGAAKPVLRRLAEQLNETVSAGVLEGADVLYVLREASSRALHVGLGAGSRLPAHASSMGIVLLAGLRPHELDAYLRRAAPLRALTALTPTAPDAVRALIAAAARDGYAHARGTVDEGVAGLSVAVRDAGGRVVAAINVSMAIGRVGRAEALRRFRPALVAAAADIARALPPWA